jgi:hypothetical protein
VPTLSSFDYAIVRVVPRVERGEFINAGVILFCRTRRYLVGRIELHESRLRALAPSIDVDEVRHHLAVIPRLCAGDAVAGPIARLALAERFHWLVAPRSTVIQTSPVHCGLCTDPDAALERLLIATVRPPAVDA